LAQPHHFIISVRRHVFQPDASTVQNQQRLPEKSESLRLTYRISVWNQSWLHICRVCRVHDLSVTEQSQDQLSVPLSNCDKTRQCISGYQCRVTIAVSETRSWDHTIPCLVVECASWRPRSRVGTKEQYVFLAGIRAGEFMRAKDGAVGRLHTWMALTPTVLAWSCPPGPERQKCS
jgi:hypothetical protein